MPTRLTLLNTMADREIAAAVLRCREWGLHWIDLKDGIWGEAILDLADADCARLAELLDRHEVGAYCLSSPLLGDPLEKGRAAFEQSVSAGVERALTVARRLRPRFIRLLAARARDCADGRPGRDVWRTQAPWLPGVYAEAARRIREAGFEATLENETRGCVLASVEDVEALFTELGETVPLSLTWDIQNLWQCGVFPSLDVYRRLQPRLAYVHLKGGRAVTPGGPLKWRSPLEQASWPVQAIVEAVIRDGVSPVLCLNPSHGEAPPEGDPPDGVARDLAFLRSLFEDIA
ncbi:MAG: sugar phosphate isomerase/epimerase [Puniceicoccaceae bacterium]|nr:MAG: sugar phosphate isomerase/epimerase [Puniceicoccaceae bacterium]